MFCDVSRGTHSPHYVQYLFPAVFAAILVMQVASPVVSSLLSQSVVRREARHKCGEREQLTCSTDALCNLPAAGHDVMQAFPRPQPHPHSSAVTPMLPVVIRKRKMYKLLPA